MTTSDFTTTVMVDATPEKVFGAVTNVRGWWSENIEGNTARLNDQFTYRFEDVHAATMRLVEVLPNEKVVWEVLENHFNFTADETEWTGTKIVFDIARQGDKTALRFTHVGLTTEFECFDVCRQGWSNYIDKSLRNLIVNGKGEPNPREGRNNYESGVQDRTNSAGKKPGGLHITAVVKADPATVFAAINNVQGWWTKNVEGKTHALNDEFSVRFGDVHFSRQKLAEFIPNKKVVWLVTESNLNFIADKREWTGTRIVFDITPAGNTTRLDFTHIGLQPQVECYEACSTAWQEYIVDSLVKLIEEGKGAPAGE